MRISIAYLHHRLSGDTSWAIGPSKISCVLNLIMQIGFGTVLCIVAGQMLSAVNGAGLSIAVGCIISALCTGLIASVGITFVHRFERCALKVINNLPT